MNTVDALKDILIDYADFDGDKNILYMDFKDDLHLDSLDKIDLLTVIDGEFSIIINPKDYYDIDNG